MVTFTGNSVDDTATYTCNSSFELIGDAMTTCTQLDMYSATFSQAPFCRREYDVTRVAACLNSCLYESFNITGYWTACHIGNTT